MMLRLGFIIVIVKTTHLDIHLLVMGGYDITNS